MSSARIKVHFWPGGWDVHIAALLSALLGGFLYHLSQPSGTWIYTALGIFVGLEFFIFINNRRK